MPRVTLLFLVGSVAICGIPPLNGFISEFLLYLGLFRQLEAVSLACLVLLAPLLALVGGLAVVAFTKLYGSVFLGTPRSTVAPHSHEAGVTMLLPMAFFALLCVLFGVAPQIALRLVSPAIESMYPQQVSPSITAGYGDLLSRLSLSGVLLLAAAALVTLFWKWRLGKAPVSAAPTWGCGYQRGTARMQYGGAAFSELTVSVFDGILRQRIKRPTVAGLFPMATHCSDQPTETFLERIILPLFALTGVSFAFLRRLQNGLMHMYVMYIFATLFILMLWAH